MKYAKLTIYLAASFFAFAFASSAHAATISQYTYAKPIFFNTGPTGANITSDQAYFPIAVHINTSSWLVQTERDAFFDTNTNGKRIQFFDSDRTTNLPYEVEYFSNVQGSEEALYWVRVPSVKAASTTDHIWVAYGNDPDNQDFHGYGSYPLQQQAVWNENGASNFKMVQHLGDNSWTGSPPEATDSTSNGNNGTNNGTTNADPAQLRKGRQFDGSSQYISLANAITMPTNLTITCVAKADSTSANPAFIFGDGTLAIKWEAGMQDSKYQFDWSNSLSDYRIYRSSSSVDTSSHIISFTQTGTSAPTFYKDSSSETMSLFVSGGNDTKPSAGGSAIGREGTRNAWYWPGWIDEFRISNIARSADWIKLEYYSMKKTNWNGDSWLTWGPQMVGLSSKINVFYSVGQDGATDRKTGSPNVTISNGIATFKDGGGNLLPQTGNIGVGDVIDYDTGNSKAYISGKVSTTQWRVITVGGGQPPDVSGKTVNSIKRVFTSLSAAISGAGGADYMGSFDMVTNNYILNLPCYYDTGADTTAVTVDGYTTGVNNYIKIYTPQGGSESNQSQRHSGMWSNAKYSVAPATGIAISVQDEYVNIEGLQIYSTDNDGIYVNVTGASGEKISNNIIKGNATAGKYGIDLAGTGASSAFSQSTPGIYTLNIPIGVTALIVDMRGGGGGGGKKVSGYTSGGGGGRIQTTLYGNSLSGGALNIYVGGGGGTGEGGSAYPGGSGGYNGGGVGGSTGNCGAGGGGGGMSDIRIGGIALSNRVIVASGGGGGGGYSCWYSGNYHTGSGGGGGGGFVGAGGGGYSNGGFSGGNGGNGGTIGGGNRSGGNGGTGVNDTIAGDASTNGKDGGNGGGGSSSGNNGTNGTPYGGGGGGGGSSCAGSTSCSSSITGISALNSTYSTGSTGDGSVSISYPSTAKISNNIIYDYTDSTGAGVYWNDIDWVPVIYNNTIYSSTGIGLKRGADAAQIIKNNLIYAADAFNGSGFTDDDSVNDYNSISENNSGEVAIGSHGYYNKSFNFVDPSGNPKNFHLTSDNAWAIDKGVNLSVDPNLKFSDDIDGDSRSSIWDIGADEQIGRETEINTSFTDSLTSGLVLYQSFDGPHMDWSRSSAEARDQSGGGYHGDVVNADQTNVKTGKRGQAIEFNGSDEYVDIGTGPGTVNTVAFWVYPKTTTEYFVNLTSNTDYIWANAGTVTATGLSGATIYVNGVATSAIVANQWQHVVVTTSSAENGSNFDIGRTQDTNYLEGYIDEVRVYNRALSASEITSLYNLGRQIGNMSLTDQMNDSGLKGMWSFDGSNIDWTQASAEIRDTSGNNNHGDAVSITKSSVRPGKRGQALNFNGSDNWINAGTGGLNMGTSDISIGMWIQRKGGFGNQQRLYIKRQADSSKWYDLYFETNNKVTASIAANFPTISYSTFDSTGTITDSNWHYIVAVFDRDNNGQIYIDGSANGTPVNISSNSGNIDNTGAAFIGSFSLPPSQYFNGLIDEVRVYNRALSPSEVSTLYRLGSAKLK